MKTVAHLNKVRRHKKFLKQKYGKYSQLTVTCPHTKESYEAAVGNLEWLKDYFAISL